MVNGYAIWTNYNLATLAILVGNFFLHLRPHADHLIKEKVIAVTYLKCMLVTFYFRFLGRFTVE